MKRLYILKLKDFWPIKVNIFETYSSRAFKPYATWCTMLSIAETTY